MPIHYVIMLYFLIDLISIFKFIKNRLIIHKIHLIFIKGHLLKISQIESFKKNILKFYLKIYFKDLNNLLFILKNDKIQSILL